MLRNKTKERERKNENEEEGGGQEEEKTYYAGPETTTVIKVCALSMFKLWLGPQHCRLIFNFKK